MLRACLLLLAGFYAPQLISFDLDSDLIPAAFVAVLAAIIVPLLRPIAWVIAGSALFVAAACDVIESRLPHELVGDSILVEVMIADFPRVRGDSVAMVAKPHSDRRLPARIRVSWYRPPVQLRLGDRWHLELRLRRPRGTANPGAFDYEAWLLRESVGAVGYVVNSHRNHLLASGPTSGLDRIRQRFVDRVVTAQEDAGRAAVLAALVVGARHLLSDAQWDRYARTGTSHLMAISGLHIGLAASGAYLLVCLALGALRFGGNQHGIAVVVALLVAALYAVVSGLAIPAQRAAAMLGIAAIAILRRRRPVPARIVISTCIAIAVVAPLSTMAPGFALSFGAVALLLWIARRRVSAINRGPVVRGLEALRTLGGVQLILLCGLLPLTAMFFGRITFAAPAVNLLAVPLFSFVTVPCALLGFVLDGAARPLGDALLAVAALSIGTLEWLIERVAAVAWSAFDVPLIGGIAALFVLLPVCWVLLPPAWPGRALGWLAALALVLHVPAAPVAGCVRVRILDVGQGLAVLVQTQNTALLYDTGPAYRGGGSAAERLIVPLLSRLRIAALDQLVVSHSDDDHAGGAHAILDALPVLELLAGETLPGVDVQQRRCDSRITWQADGIDFRFLHPQPGSSLQGNDASCVLQISAGPHRLLLTGDIERTAEARLLNRDILQAVDVVTVPHHGSRTSSTEAFVAAVKPAVAVVANAFGNRWGFPKPDVAARWRRAGADLLQTADSGAIDMHFCRDSKGIQLRRHRVARHRIWHE